MTDKEIIKALGDRMYCGKWIGKGFLDKKDFQILKNALDLINRQQAEIEKLKGGIEEEHSISQSYSDLCDYKQKEIERLKEEVKAEYGATFLARAEAIKEFAEQVKMAFYYEFDELIPSIMADKIDNLVKEMVGEQK